MSITRLIFTFNVIKIRINNFYKNIHHTTKKENTSDIFVLKVMYVHHFAVIKNNLLKRLITQSESTNFKLQNAFIIFCQ